MRRKGFLEQSVIFCNNMSFALLGSKEPLSSQLIQLSFNYSKPHVGLTRKGYKSPTTSEFVHKLVNANEPSHTYDSLTFTTPNKHSCSVPIYG